MEPMASKARRKCHMKGTQGGITEIEVLATLHGLIFKIYPKGVLYMFPTSDDVREFSQSRFGPLLLANHDLIGKYVKAGRKGTDTTSLKKIHDAFLYLRGARLSLRLGSGIGEKESSKLRSIPADKIVFDELDLMDMKAIEKAKQRMAASEKKEEVYISNPTLPDFGIHKIFLLSDQRFYHLRCGCGEWTCAIDTFPECVKIRPDGTGYIGCKKCGKEFDSKTKGEWVPKVPSKTSYMEGWQWSQLHSNTNDPAEILQDFTDPIDGNIGDVMRLRLGLPHVDAEDRLTEQEIYSCCNNELQSSSSRGPCAMGVDVGKIKHVIIGTRVDRERFEILKVIRLTKWTDIHDLARKFNVKSAIIDLYPETELVKDFGKKESYRCGFCQYTENPMHEEVWDNIEHIVKVYRTGIFDKTHRLISEKLISIPRKCDEIELFAKQMSGVAKVLEKNEKTGVSVYRYREVGNDGDHYRNAMNYFLLAAAGARIAHAGGRSHRQTHAINDFFRR